METCVDNFNSYFNNKIGWIVENMYIKIFFIFLFVYTFLARPKLPNAIEKIFENNIIRFVLITYIIYRESGMFNVAVLISLSFVSLMYYLNLKEKQEQPK